MKIQTRAITLIRTGLAAAGLAAAAVSCGGGSDGMMASNTTQPAMLAAPAQMPASNEVQTMPSPDGTP